MPVIEYFNEFSSFFRVAHFPVSKRGQLLTTSNSMLDTKQSASPRTFTTGFITPEGKIVHFFIPIHALTDKSSVHDSNLQAKLLVILQENVIDSTALIDLVRSAKSAMSKLQMMKEILRSDTENLEVCMCLHNFLLHDIVSKNFSLCLKSPNKCAKSLP